MFDNLRLAATVVWRVLFAPLWVTWRGYRILWWAFDDSDTRRAGASASLAPRLAPPPPGDAAQAFEVVDSTPAPTPPPIGALRGGYVATLLSSGLAAIPIRAGVADHHLSTTGGWVVWGWATLAVAVASLFFVRHVAREHAKRQPVGRFAQARATVAGVGRACASAARGGVVGVSRAAGLGKSVGARTVGAGRRVWSSSPLVWVRARARRVASRINAARSATGAPQGATASASPQASA